MILTKYRLMCDGCHSDIFPPGQPSTIEISMQSTNYPDVPRLFFHFHPNTPCKDRWIREHIDVLTGAIIEGLE